MLAVVLALAGPVHEKGGSVAKERTQKRVCLRHQRDLIQRPLHQRDPAFARALIDVEGGMARSETRMAAALGIAAWTAEPSHEKIAQPLFAPREVVVRIHGTEDVVDRHLRVERARQSGKSGFANHGVDIALGHLRIIPPVEWPLTLLPVQIVILIARLTRA